jgi:hypothetical protein
MKSDAVTKSGTMTKPTRTVDVKRMEELRAQLSGELLQPVDKTYAAACQAWNLNAQQHPALVVMAESKEDVIAAVQFARDTTMGIGIMATGHGVGTPCNDGMLTNTSRMRDVKIDPTSRTATVAAGALWKSIEYFSFQPEYTAKEVYSDHLKCQDIKHAD